MKERNLYRIIILMVILFYPVVTMAYPVVTMASLMPDCGAVKVEHIVTISPDYEIPQDSGAADLTPGNSDGQIIILRDGISVSVKKVTSSKFIPLYFLNRNTRNDISVPDTRELISNFHYSTLFTGVLLI